MSRLLLVAVLLCAPSVAAAGNDALVGTAASLLAPITAVAAALITRRVLPALIAGAAVAAVVYTGADPLQSLRVAAVTLRDNVLDYDNIRITTFTLLVSATVGVVGKSGGTKALIGRLEWIARGPRGAVFASWLGGLLLFFDDYANCLIVGNAMAPLYDRWKVSRAKLAYVVDSTAAPVASLAVISTWVGYELSLIDDGLVAGAYTGEQTALSLFVASIPYRFYPLLTLTFVGLLAWTGRDFGPMVAEEEAARRRPSPPAEDQPVPPHRAWLAALPVLVLVVVVVATLVRDGLAGMGDGDLGFIAMLDHADPYAAMLWGSGVALLVAGALTIAARALSPGATFGAAVGGVRAVLQALAVLYCAWLLADLVRLTEADTFLAGALSGRLPGPLLPGATFVIAALIAFATGTSFGTMGILVPLVVPLSLQLAEGQDAMGPIVLGTLGAVLAGAIVGDHASPISDTTVLSAAGSGVDVTTHVRTQMPYALVTGGVSLVVGYLPAGFGASPWLLVLVGTAVCAAVLWMFGKAPVDYVASPRHPENLIVPGE